MIPWKSSGRFPGTGTSRPSRRLTSNVRRSANPDSAKNVRWGQQTHDEMMIGYFEYYAPVAGDVVME